MANPTSNFGWQMPTNTDLVKDLPADFEVFGQAVDTSMADLKGGTTGQILSKNSNSDMDFIWIANDQGDITGITASSPLTGGGTSGAITVGIQSASTTQSGAVQLTDSTSSTSTTTAATPNSVKSAYDLANGAIAKTLIDAEGDLIVGDAADAVQRLAIGTTGQVLTVDTAVDGKIKWATASSGGMTLIETKTLNNTASTYTFSSIAGTYKHLLITGQGVTSATGSASADNYSIQFNSDTGSNYAYIQVRIIGASVSQTNDAGSTFINAGYAIGHSTATSIDYGNWAMYVYDYASNDSYKSIQFSGGHTSRDDYSSGTGLWNSTNTITSIKVTASYGNNFTNGKLKLWGIS